MVQSINFEFNPTQKSQLDSNLKGNKRQTAWKADLSWTICLLLIDQENVSGGLTAASDNGVRVSPTPAAYSGI